MPTSTHSLDTGGDPAFEGADANEDGAFADFGPPPHAYPHDRETTITQDIPVIVLAPASVALIHEPRCPQPDVHIILPPLMHIKAVSERFTKLALSSTSSSSLSSSGGPSFRSHGNNTPRLLESATSASSSNSRLLLSANMHGVLKIGVETPMLKIESRWEGLTNPELDPGQVEGGEAGVREHASTKMRQRHGEDAWSVVRVEGKDWGRVLGVGRMGGRVIACTSFPPFSPFPSIPSILPLAGETYLQILRKPYSLKSTEMPSWPPGSITNSPAPLSILISPTLPLPECLLLISEQHFARELFLLF